MFQMDQHKFLFKAWIETSVGAQGYLCLEGTIEHGAYCLEIGLHSFRENTIAELVTSIKQTLAIEFLDTNVEDICVKSCHRHRVSRGRSRVYTFLATLQW